jgi:inner membrane organizing system protein 1
MSAVASNEILARKWDYTLAQLITNTGIGLGAGLVASLLLKRRAWPIGLGTGFAWGMTYQESKSTFSIFNKHEP